MAAQTVAPSQGYLTLIRQFAACYKSLPAPGSGLPASGHRSLTAPVIVCLLSAGCFVYIIAVKPHSSSGVSIVIPVL